MAVHAGQKFAITLLHIEIAIWYYVRAPEVGDYGATEGRCNAPAVLSYTSQLASAGLLEPSSDPHRQWQATEATRVWLDHLQSQPLPVMKWSMPP